jgi:hypothetical protein
MPRWNQTIYDRFPQIDQLGSEQGQGAEYFEEGGYDLVQPPFMESDRPTPPDVVVSIHVLSIA